MMSGSFSSNRSTSSSVFSMPRLNLSEPFDRERGTFIAASTWDGSMEPVVQAEPLEAQMPSRSSSSNAASTVRVDFQALHDATGGFRDAYLLGRGGCCHVFKGDVYDYPTAIKAFNETAGAWDDKQIRAEIETLVSRIENVDL